MDAVLFRENLRGVKGVIYEDSGFGVGLSSGRGDGLLNDKTAIALKTHSEAERRRRERINGHLVALRSMVPFADKLDKAALLAEVIAHIKHLKSHATEISKNCSVPSDTDAVKVEVDTDRTNGRKVSIRATLCCEDRPDLLSDLLQTLRTLKLKAVHAEMSTLGGRVSNVFVINCEGHPSETEQHILTANIHRALKSILDRQTLSEFVPRSSMFYSKRRRISMFESSSSSS